MIAFGTAMASEATYRARALPGISRVVESDSMILLPEEQGSRLATYNWMLDQLGELEGLEALVLLYEDVEIVDDAFVSKLRRRLSEPDVAVVGVVGRRGVCSLASWEGDRLGAVAAPDGGELPGPAPEDVDVVDGLLMALSPWAVRELRFDEALAEDLDGYDMDFCLQARSLGRRVVVEELAVVHHAIRLPSDEDRCARSARALERKWGGTWAPDARSPRIGMVRHAGPPHTDAHHVSGSGVTARHRSSEEPAGEDVGAEVAGDGIRASNLVWIFSSGRSGSTWLASMMAEMDGHNVWHEPSVGALFGNFYYRDPWIGEAHRDGPLFILGRQRYVWLSLIRSFVLDAARAMFPQVGSTGTLVVRETYGSIGAPLLAEALPESRITLLIRDPRDVVASSLDAFKPDSWGFNALGAESVPEYTTEDWSMLYARNVGNARQAYEGHAGPKALLRYEDLRAHTLSTMERIYAELEIAVDERQLAAAVDKHSWETIPGSVKGQGKFYRQGVAGGWTADLTTEQVATIERITAPILDDFYPHAPSPPMP